MIINIMETNFESKNKKKILGLIRRGIVLSVIAERFSDRGDENNAWRNLSHVSRCLDEIGENYSKSDLLPHEIRYFNLLGDRYNSSAQKFLNRFRR